MKIQQKEQNKPYPGILEVYPGRFNKFIVTVLVISSVLTAGILPILYLKFQKVKNFIHFLIFDIQDTNTEEIHHFLVVDSYNQKGSCRSLCHRTVITKAYLIEEESHHQIDPMPPKTRTSSPERKTLRKFIRHNQQRYVIEGNTVKKLAFNLEKSLDKYVRQGLSQSEQHKSRQIFGKAGVYYISFWSSFTKVFHSRKLRFIFTLFALKKIIVGLLSSSQPHQKQLNDNHTIVSLVILIQIILALLVTLFSVILGVLKHNQLHQQFQKKRCYRVIREGKTAEIKGEELLVGDTILLQEGSCLFCRGYLISSTNNTYAVVNEKLYNRIDQPVVKTPYLSHLHEVLQNNIINPGSQIISLGTCEKKQTKPFSGNKQTKAASESIPPAFYVVVVQNSQIGQMYEAFQSNDLYSNYSSPRTEHQFQQLLFCGMFFIVSLSFSFWITQGAQSDHTVDILFAHIILIFPYNLMLFSSMTQLISILRLKKYKVETVCPLVEEVGMSESLGFQISTFQQLQFVGYVKRQKCNRYPVPQKFQDTSSLFEIFRKAREDSIYCFFVYCGIMNLPMLSKQKVYRQLFETFEFSFREKNDIEEDDQQPRIVNLNSENIKVDWKEYKRYPLSQRLLETVVFEDMYFGGQRNKFVVLSQGYFNKEECEDYFNQISLETRNDYTNSMKKFLLKGKKVRYLNLKRINFTNEVNLRQAESFKRENIEKRLDFGGLLIFDQWPNQDNLKVLYTLENPQVDINIFAFSIRNQESLVGYDHLFKHMQILFQQESLDRVRQVNQRKLSSRCVIYVGNGIIDGPSLVAADVSINLFNQSPAPAIYQIQEAKGVLKILQEGRWALQTINLTTYCLVLLNFSKIVGQVFLFRTGLTNSTETEPFSSRLDSLFLLDMVGVFLPLLLLNLYSPNKVTGRQNTKGFIDLESLIYLAFCLLGLITLYTIQFLDHGFKGTCVQTTQQRFLTQVQNSESNGDGESFLRMRGYISQNVPISGGCDGLISFINISFAWLVILILDNQNASRKTNLFLRHLNKLLMLGVWIWVIFYFFIAWEKIFRAGATISIIFLVHLVSKRMRANNISDFNNNHSTPQEVISQASNQEKAAQ